MPDPSITNPFGINAPQGNEVYTSQLILPMATDPAANVATVASVTSANPMVVTTSAAHGFITGQNVILSGNTMTGAGNNAGVNGTYTATVASATTFSVPFNSTSGTLTVAGKATQAFQPGQLAIIQPWSGAASGDSAANVYPTIALTPLTTASKAQIGVIIGGNTPGSPIAIGGIAQVCVSGICQVYADTTTSSTAANIGASVATPGTAKPLTATTGINIGVSLQTVTVTSAYLPQLSYIFVKLS